MSINSISVHHTTPKWYQNEKTVHDLGKFFVSMTASGTCATTLASLTFTAAPMTVILTTGGLALFTVATLIASIICLRKNEFWHDPQFRSRETKKMHQDIAQNHLSYKEIQQKYGQQIREFALLTDTDFEEIFSREEELLTYKEFKERHGLEPLSKFLVNADTRTSLCQKFRSRLILDKVGTKYIAENCKEDCEALGLQLQNVSVQILTLEINSVLAGSMTYSNFKEKNNLEFLNFVPDDLRTQLKPFFMEYIALPENKIEEEWNLLNVSKEEIKNILLEKWKNKSINTLEEFVSNYAEEGFRFEIFSLEMPQIRELVINYYKRNPTAAFLPIENSQIQQFLNKFTFPFIEEAKAKYQKLKEEFQQKNSIIQEEGNQALYHAERAKAEELQEISNVQLIQAEYNKRIINEDLNALKSLIAANQAILDKPASISTQKSQLKNKSDTISYRIELLEKELSTFDLERKKEVLKNKIEQLKSLEENLEKNPVTGLGAAFKALGERNSVKNERQSVERELMNLENSFKEKERDLKKLKSELIENQEKLEKINTLLPTKKELEQAESELKVLKKREIELNFLLSQAHAQVAKYTNEIKRKEEAIQQKYIAAVNQAREYKALKLVKLEKDFMFAQKEIEYSVSNSAL